jgi:hypothetical protein
MMIIALMLIASAHADPLPQLKRSGPGGSCPYGYFTSGSYCVPSQGAQDAVPKPPNGTCPWGWTSSGSFCVRSGKPSNSRSQENRVVFQRIDSHHCLTELSLPQVILGLNANAH